jgi:hypothetical protein
MTREEADFIGAMNMCDEISNEAYKKIMCHCEVQEPCEDAISREAAMFLILHYGNEIRHEVMDDIKASMIKLPSVTHARPKGHWIREFNDIEGEVRFTCSNCRKYQLFETDFCYHCGSDNRKEEE